MNIWKRLGLFISAIAVIFALLALNAPPQRAPFSVSQKTTWFTEPLGPDGTVNYAAALDAHLRENITTKNNAAIPLMKIFGPTYVPARQRELFYQKLGIKTPSRDNGTLVEFHFIVTEYLNANEPDRITREELQNQHDEAVIRPWSRTEFPLVLKWLEVNEKTLELAKDATTKPRFYLPIVPSDFLLGGQASYNARELAWLLAARAMLALRENRIDDGMSDLLACHRFASLLGQLPDMADGLVSYHIDFIASQADQALLSSDVPTQNQLARYRNEFESLPPLPKMSDKLDLGRRLDSLYWTCQVAMKRAHPDMKNLKKIEKRRRLFEVDWNAILKRLNDNYDEMVRALSRPTFRERQSAIEVYVDQLDQQLKEEYQNPEWITFLQFQFSRDAATRSIGNQLLAETTPFVVSVNESETRARVQRDLTRIALALGEHQRQHGKFPESLSSLSPVFLKTVPRDRFTEDELKYRPQNEGYLLYSIGANGRDDQGHQPSADSDADDCSITVPKELELKGS